MSETLNKNKGFAFPTRSLFGRRQGRTLTSERTALLDTLMPKLHIPETLLCENHTLNPVALFPKPYTSCWLEIGFGQGEHLSALMRRNPHTAFIGAEPFVNGMSAFLKDVQNDDLDLLRLLMDDGMILARTLKPASLDGVYILNPDPWHKKRHHKRRIINRKNLDTLAKIIKPHGKLIITTDVEDLAEWIITHLMQHDAFMWTAQRADDWRIKPQDWISTRYETKGAKGAKKMVYLIFERKGE